MPPVADHPTHEKTKVGADHRYGCNNRPRPDPESGYWAPDRVYTESGAFIEKPVFVKHYEGMSIACRYDLAKSDKQCAGCRHQTTDQDIQVK